MLKRVHQSKAERTRDLVYKARWAMDVDTKEAKQALRLAINALMGIYCKEEQ